MKTTLKKVFALTLCAIMCVSLAACNSNNSNKNTNDTSKSNNLDMSTSELDSYLGKTEKEVLSFLNIDDSKLEREDVSENQSDIKLKDKFEYGGAQADVTLTVTDDRFLFISYRFGDAEKNGEEYQKAAFGFAKAVEKALSAKYEAVEYYNGDLNELDESTFTGNTESSKSWFREYVTEDEFGLIEKFNESPLAEDVKYDELRIVVTLNKLNSESAKIGEVNIGIKGGTKTNPQ